MLTKADLTRAMKLISERDTAQRIRDRVTGQRVALMVGEGKDAGEVVLSAAYLAQIIADVTASLDQQITAANAALTDMGVEP
ncbi:MAG: hypothetical protein EOR77_25865 [Mesorhizobium sp.]|uniref:hypothetical protein n=1 Tax=Mesorhizobium sp. TaxID=1871066 RepID=UPI000FE7E0E5|nr:hypothetical protein [Mesorhizobium sp.]RWH88021.1 MAG: hypothetical protein EOQ87_23355 [Mesorhizobium sp.]RWM30256.1 MAG: hypothetical protein EOR77_25865 [Mesorhizobium sp.]TJV32029.1 MAG: hypothetical protein E5X87_21285 [Mesorhizobium sp.]TJW50907.1 MAG: hypothetical protein E5X65_25745 [Mesorhizobium sp.]